MRSKILLFLTLLVPALSFGQQPPPYDQAGSYQGSPSSYPGKEIYKGVEIRSLYLPMSDGEKLAVDIYLPRGLKKGQKLPVLLHQTRYWRRPQMRFPYNLLSNGLIGRTGDMIKKLIANGYIIVNVDVRGSGASTGQQAHPWTKEEVQDGYEIVDWIIKQDWATDKVGSLGVSYSGTAAEMLACKQHPNLKAIVPMFSLFDVFEDNAFIGGIHNQWFTESWGKANEAMDANNLPENYLSARKYIKGVALVKQAQRRKMLKTALSDHQANKNVHHGALGMDFRDDPAFDGAIPSLDAFSPHAFVQLLDQSGVAVYSYSGWHDGAYQYSALKRHWNLSNPANKLILGPWEHGGAFRISPFSRAKAAFDHAGEILKFFDYHLKGVKNGLEQEAPIHYYTMGLERWQSSQVFPPAYTSPICFYLNGSSLSSQSPSADRADTLSLDTAWGSGDASRWKAVNGKIKSPNTYHDWSQRSRSLPAWESPVLTQEQEMSGIPLLELFLSCSASDGSVFVYLEDVQPNGDIYQVTEGQLRLSQRQLNEGQGLYKHSLDGRSHLRKDAKPMPINEIETVKLDLLPVSYLFKKGHKIRVSFSLCDKDHFEIINPQGYQIRLHQSPSLQPKLWLDMRK